MKSVFAFLLLILLSPMTQVMAADYSCAIGEDFVLRDANGNALSERVNGTQVCSGQPQLRSFIKDGRTRNDYFVQVKTPSGQLAWVSAKGATQVSALVNTANTNVVAAAIPDKRFLSVEYGGNLKIEEDFRIRSSPTIGSSDNVIGTTGNENLTFIYNDNGMMVTENGMAKAQRADGSIAWVHESAFSVTELQGTFTSLPLNNNLPASPSNSTTALTNTNVSVTTASGEVIPIHIEPIANPAAVQPAAATAPAVAPVTAPVTDHASPLEIQRAEQALVRKQLAEQRTARNAAIAAANGTPMTAENMNGFYTQLGIPEQGLTASEATALNTAAGFGPPPGNFPVARPANLQAIRAKFAESKTDEGFQLISANNWGRVKVGTLNLRNAPGTSGTSVVGKISEGGRVAVIDSKIVNGRTWHKVIPFDCANVSAENSDPNLEAEDACNGAYWVAGSNIEAVTAPTLAEIQARPAPQEYSEAGHCIDCQGVAALGRSDIKDLGQEILAAAEEADGQLFEEYVAFQKRFIAAHPRSGSVNNWARRNKDNFISSMIAELGMQKANDIILVLTAFGEARGEGEGEYGNMAEMGTVMTIINNRAASGYANNDRGIQNLIGDSSAVSAQMRAALQPSQFSVWNKGDNNLGTIMVTSNNVQRGVGDSAALARAFKTLELMESRQIVPMGQLASTHTRHYHARTMDRQLVDWVGLNRSIRNPQMMTPGGPVTIVSHMIYEDIR